MGEGYPQGAEEQLPTQEQEGEGSQTVETTDQTSESVETQDVLAERRDEPDADTRWDHDKAETMAAVLKEDGTFDDVIESKDITEEYVNSKEYVDNNTERESRWLKEAQEIVSHPSPYMDGEKRLAGAQDAYDTAVAKTQAMGQDSIEKARKIVDKAADEVLSPYQELYDRNPAVFAEMSTKEFMAIAKEFAEASGRIERDKEYSRSLKWFNDEISKAIEQKKSVRWEVIASFSRAITESLDMSPGDWTDVRDKFEAEIDERFDKTPRQIMEAYVRIGQEYTSQFEAKKLADEQRSKELLDKYGPETSGQDQN